MEQQRTDGQTDERLIRYFEESFRNIEASRLGEAVLELCQAVSDSMRRDDDDPRMQLEADR